jgi:CBS domain-containing protein
MTEPLTVAAGTPLLEVQHLLALAQVSAMPVVEDGGRVIGLLSASHVVRALDQALDGDIDEGELDSRIASIATLTARDIGTPDIVWISADTPVLQIADRMRAEQVSRVLVGDADHLEGIVTAFDLLVAIA